MTTTPRIATLSRTKRMASTAAWSASSFSPRPIQRAAAIAAASVTRTSSIAMLRSGACRALTSADPKGLVAALDRMRDEPGDGEQEDQDAAHEQEAQDGRPDAAPDRRSGGERGQAGDRDHEDSVHPEPERERDQGEDERGADDEPGPLAEAA